MAGSEATGDLVLIQTSVGRVPDNRAGGRGFKPRPDHHSGSLKIIEEKSVASVMTSANG